ncbi:Protein ABHD15 [Amphibalanus amphitrite]|uniref:Protein ABHD15 n=1 Tax=Amphibalanus amphitrite TaxID=1232801 RepID=A0A6A4V686_AMPAM|nr:Protein ABHD15 [Amphibalanus amphitrite]
MALLEDSLELLLDAFRQCAGLMLVLGTFTHLCLWLVGRRVVRPRLYFKPSSLSRHLQRHMSALERPFTVPRLLIPRHLQTLLGPLAVAAGAPSPSLLYRRQYLQLRDRCSVPLDWAEPLGGGTADPAARVLLVLPDLLLDDSRLYAPVCRRALAAGCLPVVVNFRQLVRNNLPASRVAALYDVTDLRWVVRYMRAVCPGRRLAAVGFGNGGSLLLAYLGEHGISCQLAAAAVVSPAWSYAAHLLGDACAPYAALTTLREKYRVYRRATDSSTVVGGASEGDGSFADFHRRVHGDDEERHNPVIDIDEVSVPLLAVHADDDPVYGAAGLPLQLFTAFPHLFLLRAPLGGHCGFYTGSGVSEACGKNGRSETAGSVSWAADTAVQFIDSVCGFLDVEDAGGAGGLVRAARRVAARVARRSAAAATPRVKNPGHTSDGGGQIVESASRSVEDANRSQESGSRSQEQPTCPQMLMLLALAEVTIGLESAAVGALFGGLHRQQRRAVGLEPLRTVTMPSLIGCAAACTAHPGCKAVNHGPAECELLPQRVCETANATLESDAAVRYLEMITAGSSDGDYNQQFCVENGYCHQTCQISSIKEHCKVDSQCQGLQPTLSGLMCRNTHCHPPEGYWPVLDTLFIPPYITWVTTGMPDYLKKLTAPGFQGGIADPWMFNKAFYNDSRPAPFLPLSEVMITRRLPATSGSVSVTLAVRGSSQLVVRFTDRLRHTRQVTVFVAHSGMPNYRTHEVRVGENAREHSRVAAAYRIEPTVFKIFVIKQPPREQLTPLSAAVMGRFTHLLSVLLLCVLPVLCQHVRHPQHYCRLSQEHQLCNRRPPSSSCGRLLWRGTTPQQRKHVLEMHNVIRSQVARGNVQGFDGFLPPAADMIELEWDDELAEIAQAHVEKCKFLHDCGDCKKTGKSVN